MGKVHKATGAGLKHFFGARQTRSTLKDMGGKFGRANTKLKKAEILAVMGMYTVYKGTPIAFGKKIYDGIKGGKWNHGDLRQHQQSVDHFFANIQISDDGKRVVADLVRSGGSSAAAANLSPADAAAFRQFETDINIAAGNCICINF